VFDDQGAGRNEAGDFRVAEFAEQTEHISINRLRPNALARIEVAAHQRRLDARIKGRRVERIIPPSP